LHGLLEDRAQGIFVVAPETPEAVVIGSDEAAQPEQRQMIATGRFEFAGGADAMEIALILTCNQ
jgi:hypothetical protein